MDNGCDTSLMKISPISCEAILTVVGAFGVPVVMSARALLDTVAQAVSLARTARPEHRVALFGEWQNSVEAIRAGTGNTDTIDFVMIGTSSRDLAVFAGAQLRPRRMQFFDGWDAWRQREPAKFMRDSRAANKPPAVTVVPPDFIVVVADGMLTLQDRR